MTFRTKQVATHVLPLVILSFFLITLKVIYHSPGEQEEVSFGFPKDADLRNSKLKSHLQNPPCGSAGIVQSQATDTKCLDDPANPPCGSLGTVQIQPLQ
jgi:hypothetical protein